MLYTKIKMESPDYPKRFYRIIAVKGDPDLYELGAILGLSVQAWFEHYYYFEDKNNKYLPDCWMDDPWSDASVDVSMHDAHLSNLNDCFTYCYDTGQNWEFNCKIYKKKYEYVSEFDDYPSAMVLEGKGQGIFENDHYTLDRYLEGLIPADSSEEILEDDYQTLPMNMSFEVYGDFDKPLDLDYFEFFDDQIEEIAEHFSDGYDDEEKEDEIDEEEQIIRFRSSVAALIFNDEEVNNTYRRMIENMDINDAYETLVQEIANFVQETDPCDEDEFNKKFKKMLKKLS